MEIKFLPVTAVHCYTNAFHNARVGAEILMKVRYAF